MTDFTANTSKDRIREALTALTQRAKSALQKIELLKEKESWVALIKPDRVRSPRRSRLGLTMFDAALWMLVSIGVLAGIVLLYNSVTDTLRTTALRTQLTRAVAIIERDHNRSGVYATGSLLVFLNNEGFSGKELIKDSGGAYVFTSPFDTPIDIVGDGARDFTVTLTDIPASGCEVAVAVFADRGAGLDSLEIGGTDVAATDEKAVSEACDNAVNTVALTF